MSHKNTIFANYNETNTRLSALRNGEKPLNESHKTKIEWEK